jgi:translation initiation factor 5B
VKGIQDEETQLDIAKKGDSVAISMDEPTFGRQVREGQTLYTRVTDADERLLKGEYSSIMNDDEKHLLDTIIGIKAHAKES